MYYSALFFKDFPNKMQSVYATVWVSFCCYLYLYLCLMNTTASQLYSRRPYHTRTCSNQCSRIRIIFRFFSDFKKHDFLRFFEM